MTYDVIALACEQLNYRDKLRLAQLLIQLARKEEETANPQVRVETKPIIKDKPEVIANIPTEPADTINYIVERLLKLRPSKRKTLVNSIKAMYQFQGGISDTDVEKIITNLQKKT